MIIYIKYSKRNKYKKLSFYGRNNLGHKTIKGLCSSKLKIFMKKNLNYTYIFINRIIFVLKALILSKVSCDILRKTFIKIFIFDFKYNSIKYLPFTKHITIKNIIFLGKLSPIKIGNILPIYKLYIGSFLHHAENLLFRGGVFSKSSKNSIRLLFLGDKYATIKLPSGKIRLLNKNCFCIYGELVSYPKTYYKKAGNSKYYGFKPKVRGVAMNACDHPHGGGEGKSRIGKRFVYSSLKRLFRGVKTNKNNKYKFNILQNF